MWSNERDGEIEQDGKRKSGRQEENGLLLCHWWPLFLVMVLSVHSYPTTTFPRDVLIGL